MDQTKDECIDSIYQDLLRYSNEKIANLVNGRTFFLE